MPKTTSGGDKKHGDPLETLIERTGERSSPGSGEDEDADEDEDEDGNEAADLQPDDVESGDTAR
jgi:hypothetical protein